MRKLCYVKSPKSYTFSVISNPAVIILNHLNKLERLWQLNKWERDRLIMPWTRKPTNCASVFFYFLKKNPTAYIFSVVWLTPQYCCMHASTIWYFKGICFVHTYIWKTAAWISNSRARNREPERGENVFCKFAKGLLQIEDLFALQRFYKLT